MTKRLVFFVLCTILAFFFSARLEAGSSSGEGFEELTSAGDGFVEGPVEKKPSWNLYGSYKTSKGGSIDVYFYGRNYVGDLAVKFKIVNKTQFEIFDVKFNKCDLSSNGKSALSGASGWSWDNILPEGEKESVDEDLLTFNGPVKLGSTCGVRIHDPVLKFKWSKNGQQGSTTSTSNSTLPTPSNLEQTSNNQQRRAQEERQAAERRAQEEAQARENERLRQQNDQQRQANERREQEERQARENGRLRAATQALANQAGENARRTTDAIDQATDGLKQMVAKDFAPPPSSVEFATNTGVYTTESGEKVDWISIVTDDRESSGGDSADRYYALKEFKAKLEKEGWSQLTADNYPGDIGCLDFEEKVIKVPQYRNRSNWFRVREGTPPVREGSPTVTSANVNSPVQTEVERKQQEAAPATRQNSQDVSAEQPAKPIETANAAGFETYVACGKAWLVGRSNINWDETQSWAKGLGGGWRTPTKAEFKELFKAVGEVKPFRSGWFWAELKNPDSAWCFDYRDGTWWRNDRNQRHQSIQAVAVREAGGQEAAKQKAKDESTEAARQAEQAKIVFSGDGRSFSACDLEWQAGPDRGMDYKTAQGWINSLVGGWQTPKPEQLESLFNTGIKLPFKRVNNVTIWSTVKDPKNFWAFDFKEGVQCYGQGGDSGRNRALAVRSR
ncbi:MAG: hypothetical protein HQM09_14500 [Candidatus Riflebacteria bacterium]|nr:hypothetical protein [Candidatus Riflebacteria bacterium]